jgi:DNA-binding IclR family transcriptional regulator
MREDGIPEDLYAFIAKHLDSVADLEALLLLRENPSREWSASVVAKRLYISEQDAIRVLARLTQDGLLTSSGNSYRYDCRAGDLQVSVDNLAEAYRRQLVAITNIIHSKARRIREFAEAFKLKKDQ